MIQASNNKFLVPIDFTEQSVTALKQAYVLAQKYGASITLLHVVEDRGSIAKIFSDDQHQELKVSILKDLEKLTEGLDKKGNIVMNAMVVRGSVYEKVTEFADSTGATMIVMGTNGDSNIKKRFIGSNALRVVRESKIPVITIKGKKIQNEIRNIVLPLDLSKETKEKLSVSLELSRLFDNAVIRVVSVVFTTDEFVVNRLTRQLGQVKALLEKEGVECSAEIVKGTKGEDSLAENILEYADKVDGDIIMIMTQQELDFTKYFVGSSAQEIINQSNIPVFSIRPVFRKDNVPSFKSN
jgi:nucleotide-binding universal stress UspA family protein